MSHEHREPGLSQDAQRHQEDLKHHPDSEEPRRRPLTDDDFEHHDED